jgi:hypothetical protein
MALGPMPMPPGVPGGGLPPGGAPGAMPPGMQAPPGNLGPATIPQNNPGNILQAMQKLQAATKMITEALPQIPMGTELHGAVLKIAADLSKHIGEAHENHQNQIQTLLQAIQSSKNDQQMGMLNRVSPPPNQPPAMPAPGGAGAPPPAMAA